MSNTDITWQGSQTGVIPRNCSSCGYEWSFEETVYVEKGPSEAAAKRDLGKLIEHHSLTPNVNCICPSCGELARETLDIYFRNGCAHGLMKLYNEFTPLFSLNNRVLFAIFFPLVSLFTYLGFTFLMYGGWFILGGVLFIVMSLFGSVILFYLLYASYICQREKRYLSKRMKKYGEKEIYARLRDDVTSRRKKNLPDPLDIFICFGEPDMSKLLYRPLKFYHWINTR